MQINLKVLPEFENIQLNVFLRKNNISVNQIKKIKFLPDGILVDGIKQNTNYKLKVGQNVTLNIYDTQQQSALSTVIPQNIPLEIVYQDEYCMVVDKPYDMPVHPSMNHPKDTLANAFCGYWKQKGEDRICRVINRLDRNTSGLVLIALDPVTAESFKNNVEKIYTAIAHGKMQENYGVIEQPIAREGSSIITRCVDPNGQWAKTEYWVVAKNDKYTLADIKLHSGRTHQIRVHFSYIGHPLAGDDMYKGNLNDIKRHALHCRQLTFFTHDFKKIVVNSELPNDMLSLSTNLPHIETKGYI